MTSALRLLRLILTPALLWLVPEACFAFGGADISAIFSGLITVFQSFWVIVGIIVISSVAMDLMLAREEGRLDKAKKAIIGVTIGGIIITIMITLDPVNFTTLISYVYNGTGMNAFAPGNLQPLGIEAEGVASWILSLSAVVGVLMVIISMVEAVSTLGGDEAAYTQIRTALLHVVLGLLVIVSAKIFRTVFFVTHEPSALMLFIMSKLALILGFILFLAMAILIYAGFRMVISFGREEDFTNAKNLIIRVLIGIFVILISFSLVWIVATAFT